MHECAARFIFNSIGARNRSATVTLASAQSSSTFRNARSGGQGLGNALALFMGLRDNPFSGKTSNAKRHLSGLDLDFRFFGLLHRSEPH